MDIFIDNQGESSLLNKEKLIDSEDELDFGEFDLNPTKLRIEKPRTRRSKVSLNNDIDLDDFETDMGWRNKDRKKPKGAKKRAMNVGDLEESMAIVEKVLEKTAIKPGFEQLNSAPRYDTSRRLKKAMAERERERSKGGKWFDLPATEITEDVKHDLEIIQMRSALDPKHFYKKNDVQALPKYFQIGKVVDTPLDYYNGRLTKKQRKRTIVDELMNDADFSKYNKRKYKEIVDEKRKLHYKSHRHARRLKGKKNK